MTQEKDPKEREVDFIIARILQGRATAQDIKFFTGWIKYYRNEIYFDRFKEMWNVAADNEYIASNPPLDVRNFILYIRVSLRKERERRRVFRFTVSAAATIILLIGATLLSGLFNDISDNKPDLAALIYSKEPIRVELDNGKIIKNLTGMERNLTVLDEKTISSVRDSLAGSQTRATFNTVSTPSGERVTMLLSDGTKVFLTSNSYLKYPSRFGKDRREVVLVGRAYFEVAKSKVPFVVNTADMNIEVLGTSFDVESRISAASSSVILVEGSVKVLSQGQTTIIHPDEQMRITHKDRGISVRNVDSKLLTMWKDGVLVVHGQTFGELIENLSSWYGVKIMDRTSVPAQDKFNGRFDREDIESAIKAVCISANTIYKIEDGMLILEDSNMSLLRKKIY